LHPWKEPIERFSNEAEKKNLNLATPRIGQIMELGGTGGEDWWSSLS
jgi:hypothetical protein